MAEFGMQVEFAQWLDRRGHEWTHIPMEREDAEETRKMRMAGAKAGSADVVIFDPVPGHPEIRGVAIELKTHTGVVSGVQEVRHKRMKACGWLVEVVRSVREGQAICKKLWPDGGLFA